MPIASPFGAAEMTNMEGMFCQGDTPGLQEGRQVQGPLAIWALPPPEPYPQFSIHHAQAKTLSPSQDVAQLPSGIQ